DLDVHGSRNNRTLRQYSNTTIKTKKGRSHSAGLAPHCRIAVLLYCCTVVLLYCCTVVLPRYPNVLSAHSRTSGYLTARVPSRQRRPASAASREKRRLRRISVTLAAAKAKSAESPTRSTAVPGLRKASSHAAIQPPGPENRTSAAPAIVHRSSADARSENS